MRDQDHKLHQRPIRGAVKTERPGDIGESQAEDRDANDPSDPGFYAIAVSAGGAKRLAPRVEPPMNARKMLITARHMT